MLKFFPKIKYIILVILMRVRVTENVENHLHNFDNLFTRCSSMCKKSRVLLIFGAYNCVIICIDHPRNPL